MLRKLRRRLTFANVVSMTALFVALGGGAYAAANIDSRDIVNDSIRSKDVKNAKLKGKDVKDDKLKGDDIKESTLVGVEAGNVYWAVVADPAGPFNAKVAQGGQAGTGAAEVGEAVMVDFGTDVSKCAWVATRSAPEASDDDPGYAQTALGETPTTVDVTTRDAAGAAEDADFHLVVVC